MTVSNVGGQQTVVTPVGKRVTIVLLVLMMTFSPWIVVLPVNSGGNAVLSFSPAQSSTAFPLPVTLNVTVSNVVNLNGWQIKVVFNPAMLACSDVVVPLDNMLGPLSGTSGLYVMFDNTVGYVKAFVALDGTQVVSGSGTLCQITFSVLQAGMSAVTFADVGVRIGGTALFDANVDRIPFSTLNGNVQVGGSGFQSYTFSCMKEGIAYDVGLFTNSTVSSFSYNETANTATFFLSGLGGTVGSCTGSIPLAMMNGTLVILVNSSATYSSQSKDSLNEYLCFSYGQSNVRVEVLATIPGDLNGDRKTDMRDLAMVAKAFGGRAGSPRWNPIADTNGDGVIDMKDASFVAKNFGRTYWQS
jgi:hypothetical protein